MPRIPKDPTLKALTAIPRIGLNAAELLVAKASHNEIAAVEFGFKDGRQGQNQLSPLMAAGLLVWAVQGETVRLTAKARAIIYPPAPSTHMSQWEITDHAEKKAILQRTGISIMIAGSPKNTTNVFAAHNNECSYIALVVNGSTSVYALHESTHGDIDRRKKCTDGVRLRLSQSGYKAEDPATIVQH